MATSGTDRLCCFGHGDLTPQGVLRESARVANSLSCRSQQLKKQKREAKGCDTQSLQSRLHCSHIEGRGFCT